MLLGYPYFHPHEGLSQATSVQSYEWEMVSGGHCALDPTAGRRECLADARLRCIWQVGELGGGGGVERLHCWALIYFIVSEATAVGDR